MLYSQLLRRPKVLLGEPFFVRPDAIDTPSNVGSFQFTDAEKHRLDEYISEMQELQRKGCNMIIVTYPAGSMKQREEWLMRATVCELTKRFSLKYFDLERQIPRDQLEFTDSVHFAPQSAADVIATIKATIKHLESPQ